MRTGIGGCGGGAEGEGGGGGLKGGEDMMRCWVALAMWDISCIQPIPP